MAEPDTSPAWPPKMTLPAADDNDEKQQAVRASWDQHALHRRSIWHIAEDHILPRKSSARQSQRRASLTIQRRQTTSGRHWWKFTLRPWDDDDEQDWWFASTAVPLLAATIAPLANVMSIAALVTEWRLCLVDGVDKANASACIWDQSTALVSELSGESFRDPRWCYWMNVVSLIVGFIGNFFLLCNFTNRIRYIIALPMSIIMWYIATGVLIAITVAMEVYVPPVRPQQTYTQGFWYAVIAACLYLICSMLLMVNMLGYFLGHYPQHFTLTESQRTLILQTMLFFVWLAGGGAVFSTIERKYGQDDPREWSYTNALYFCDVTILTVGFGDVYPTYNVSRGLVFPYSIGGIIMLGLMVSSISKFAKEIGAENIVKKHVERSRARTLGRTVTTEREYLAKQLFQEGQRPVISAPILPEEAEADDPPSSADECTPVERQQTIQISNEKHNRHQQGGVHPAMHGLKRVATMVTKPGRPRKSRLILLREEKDRFDAMRAIQHDTTRFKRWYALCLSIVAFALLWCVGAVVFWRCERYTQDMTYFEALYFCYVSLLTIGYGDLAPKSSPGRPFFVLWSLVAVPTMTILVSDLGDTVIHKFKHGTFKLADFTVLPQKGVWREFLDANPWLLNWLQQHKRRREAKQRLEEGFQAGPAPDSSSTSDVAPAQTLEQIAKDKPSVHELARRLTVKIRQVADDMSLRPHIRYPYEDWVEFTQLIRFTAVQDLAKLADEEEQEGLIEWDWIGEDSPMMSKGTEAEFVLNRLCESMQRYIKGIAAAVPDPAILSEEHRPGSTELTREVTWTRRASGVSSDSSTRSPGGYTRRESEVDPKDPGNGTEEVT